MLTHRHHIIPKHVGGTDDPSNIVVLTIEEHAKVHQTLFEEHGRWQDYIAWKTLSGRMTTEEAIRECQKNADKTWMKTDEGKEIMRAAYAKSRLKRGDPWNKGKTKFEDERLMISSKLASQNQKEGRIPSIGDFVRGKPKTEDHRKSLSDAAKNRKKVTCENCMKQVIPQMYARWHGTNCKFTPGEDIKTIGSKSRRG